MTTPAPPVTMSRFATAREVKGTLHFIRACERAGIPPTKRQAQKWNRKVGRAWQFRKDTYEQEGIS